MSSPVAVLFRTENRADFSATDSKRRAKGIFRLDVSAGWQNVSSCYLVAYAGGYLFAALTNLFLSTLMDTVLSGMGNPWRAVILIWAGISLFGFAASLFGREEPRQD